MKKMFNKLKVDDKIFKQHVEKEGIKHRKDGKKQSTKHRIKSNKSQLEKITKLYKNIKAVLCIGCRDESEVEAFESLNLKAFGIDVTHESKKIKKIPAEIIDTCFDKNSYDIAYCSHSLEHVIIPEKVLKNIRNICKVGCYVILPLEDNNRKPGIDHPVIYDISCVNTDSMSKTVQEYLDEDFKQFMPYELIYNKFYEKEVHLAFKWHNLKKSDNDARQKGVPFGGRRWGEKN